MTYPVQTIHRPSELNGQTNGKISDTHLTAVPGLAGGPTVTLCKTAARSWKAMTAAAQAAGITLKAVGVYDSYRPYSVQESIFRARYRTYDTGSGHTKTWQGRTWWRLAHVATAAVPGTSNHGWGLAVDTGSERDGDPSAESIDQRAIDWLKANADEYGWSWELESEPWHLHYYAGDAIPAAVLAYERKEQSFPTPPRKIQEKRMLEITAKGRILKKGDTGPEVKALQRNLKLYANQTSLLANGKFDDATVTAVNNVKRLIDRPADGVAGGAVWGFFIKQALQLHDIEVVTED